MAKRKKTKKGNALLQPPNVNTHLIYDPFTARGLVQVVAGGVFSLVIEATTKGRGGIPAMLKAMADGKTNKTVIWHPKAIDICFFPAFAKQLLKEFEEEMENKK